MQRLVERAEHDPETAFADDGEDFEFIEPAERAGLLSGLQEGQVFFQRLAASLALKQGRNDVFAVAANAVFASPSKNSKSNVSANTWLTATPASSSANAAPPMNIVDFAAVRRRAMISAEHSAPRPTAAVMNPSAAEPRSSTNVDTSGSITVKL